MESDWGLRMIPSPTPELLLIAAALRTHVGDSTKRCSKFMHGMRDNLRLDTGVKVRALRQALPAMEEASEGAGAVLHTLCTICPMRGRCRAPLV